MFQPSLRRLKNVSQCTENIWIYVIVFSDNRKHKLKCTFNIASYHWKVCEVNIMEFCYNSIHPHVLRLNIAKSWISLPLAVLIFVRNCSYLSSVVTFAHLAMHADRQTCFCRFGFWRFRLHTFCHFRWHSSQSPKGMLQICKSSQGVYSVSAKHKLKWTVFLHWTLQILFIVKIIYSVLWSKKKLTSHLLETSLIQVYWLGKLWKYLKHIIIIIMLTYFAFTSEPW